jgi:hypothetical protein
MEMVVRSMETAEMVMEPYGDGSGGHFPIPAGYRNRDFYPLKFIGGGGGAAEHFLEICRFI